MIVVDTSALMAIITGEDTAASCIETLETETEIFLSAGTMAEALIVAARRNVREEMTRLIQGLGFTIAPVTEDLARRVAEAYDRWGKGVHGARLNFGDCFAYALAKAQECRLLYVGNDFAQTDVEGCDIHSGAKSTPP